MGGLAKLSGDSASKYYYEKDPIMNEAGNGENLVWYGKGAEALGLNSNDKVNKEDFESILDGKFKDVELRYLDKKTEGEDRKAYDLVFSASKSISHLGLVMGDERVLKAFDDANKTTIDFVETLSQKREYSGEGARVKKDTGNLIVAQAKHSIARPVNGMIDPSLHTHNVIMNTTKGEDGKFTSLSSDKIYQNQGLIQEVFKSELAKNLKDQGFGITVNEKGDIEIAGYDKELRDQFSKRHFEISRIKDELRNDPKYSNLSEKKLDFMAQHNFKESKIDISKEDLKESWDKQTEQIISKDQLLKNIDEAKKEIDNNPTEKLTASEGLKLALAFKTETEVIVSETKLLETALKIGRGDYTINDLKDEITKVENDKTSLKNRDLDTLVSLGERENAKGKVDRYFTSVNIFEDERKILENISKGKQFEPIMSKEDASNYLVKIEQNQGFAFSEDQREAYFTVLNSTDQFIAINGFPGTGKTTLFNGLRLAVEEHKGVEYAEKLYTLLATTGKAASGAQEEAKMNASTVHSFLINKGNLSAGSIKDIVNERLENIKDKNDNSSENKKSNKVDVMKNYEERSSKIEQSLKEKTESFVVSTNDKVFKKEDNSNEIKHTRNSILEDRKNEVLNFREQNIANIPTKAHTEGLREYGRNTHKGVSVGLSGVFKQKFSFDGSKQTSWSNNTVEGRTTHIKQSGKIELKDPDTKKNLGIVLNFDKKIEIQERAASTSTKTDTSFSDGTKQKTISTTSNIFGKESSYGAKTLFGNDKRDKEGNRVFKTTISKKASDLLYKSEKFEHVKSSQDDKYKKGFEKNEKAILGGLLYKSETSSFGKKEGHNAMVERETKGSFLGGMVKFENTNFDYKKNGVLQETGTKTDIYVFGKRVENNFIKGMLNSSTLDGTYKTDLEKVESFVNKVKEVSNSISSYFSKDDKLEYKKITSETKGVRQDEMKVVELSKIDKDKTAVSVSSYSKSPKKEGYSLDRTETRIVDKDIEKVSKETYKLKDEMKLDKDVVKEDKKDNNVKGVVEEKELLKTTSVKIMDEASMVDGKTGNKLIQHIIDNNERLISVGDTAQIKSVGAMEVFDRLLKKSTRTDLTNINRQREADDITKEVVVKMTAGDVRGSLSLLDKQGKFKEMTKEDFMNFAVGKTLEDQDKNQAILQKNDDINKYNDAVREKKFGTEALSKAKKFETHQDKRFDGEKKFFAKNYEKDDLITMKVKTASGKERVSNYTVKEINVEKNQLLVSSDKKTFTVNLTKESQNISNVYKVEQKSFLEGDKILMLKNDKKNDVMNGQFGTVKSVNEKEGKLTIDFNGKIKEIDLNNDNSKKINYGYTSSIHKFQGDNKVNTFVYMESKSGLTNLNTANVGGSRHKISYTLFTDNKSDLIDRAEKAQVKETTLSKDEMNEFKDKDFKEFKEKENFIKGSDNKSSQNEEKYPDFKLSDLDKFKTNDKTSDKDVSNENSLNKEDKSSEKHSEKDVLKENKISSSNKKDEVVGEKFNGPDEELSSSKENRKEKDIDFNKSSEISSKR